MIKIIKQTKVMNNEHFLLLILIPVFFASCNAAKIYTKPNAMTYATKHKTLAILPPRVNIEVKKKDNLENTQAQETVESVNAQDTMNSRFLDFVQKGNMYVDIQTIEETNAIFEELGYPYNMPPKKLAEALGVDAILYADCVYSKKSAVALGIVFAIMTFPYGTAFGVLFAENGQITADVNVKLYDGTTGYLLYNYYKKLNSITTQEYDRLIDNATKEMVKKSPYYRK